MPRRGMDFEGVMRNGTTERPAPLPSPGRGRWRGAQDEGPFCGAKRWGVSPMKTCVGANRPSLLSAAATGTGAPSSVSFADSFPQGKPNRCGGTGDGGRRTGTGRELRIATTSLRTGLAMTDLLAVSFDCTYKRIDTCHCHEKGVDQSDRPPPGGGSGAAGGGERGQERRK